eukprot:scaffold3100_cov403-Prasinococcus_capsulatus_cf.AAC.6
MMCRAPAVQLQRRMLIAAPASGVSAKVHGASPPARFAAVEGGRPSPCTGSMLFPSAAVLNYSATASATAASGVCALVAGVRQPAFCTTSRESVSSLGLLRHSCWRLPTSADCKPTLTASSRSSFCGTGAFSQTTHGRQEASRKSKRSPGSRQTSPKMSQATGTTNRTWSKTVRIPSGGAGCHLITSSVLKQIPELKEVTAGLANLWLRDSTASLSVNENADPTVRSDLEGALQRIMPNDFRCSGAAAGMLSNSLDVPVHSGRPAFGTWQGLYLIETTGDRDFYELEVTVHEISSNFMRDSTKIVEVKSPSRGFFLATDKFASSLPRSESQSEAALCNMMIQHTSASLTVNENADPDVRSDLERAFNKIVPEAWNQQFFEHTYEGPDDMPAHVKSTLIGPSLSIPVNEHGQLLLGTWQGITIGEHRNVGGWGSGMARRVVVTRINGCELQWRGQISIKAGSPGCHDITTKLQNALIDILPQCKAGTLHIFIKHTSASVGIGAASCASGGGGKDQEGSLDALLESVVPRNWSRSLFDHTMEGDDDMPAHVKSTLIGCGVTVPVRNGELLLAPEQQVLLCEHRDYATSRSLVLTLMGSRSP